MELISVGAFLDAKLRKTIRANSHLCSMLFFMLSNSKSIFHLFSITSFKPLLLAPQQMSTLYAFNRYWHIKNGLDFNK